MFRNYFYSLIVVTLIFSLTQYSLSQILSRENSLVKTAETKIDFTNNQRLNTQKNVISTSKGITISESQIDGIVISEPIQIPLESPEPFIAINSIWQSEQTVDNSVAVKIQCSRDGIEWEEWENFSVDEHGQPKDEEYVGKLLFFPKEMKYFRYRIELQKNDGLSPIIKNIRFVFISPGATPTNILNEIKKCEPKESDNKIRFPFPGKENTHQVDTNILTTMPHSFPQPAYVTRTTWQCPDGQNSPLWTPQYTTVTHLIIHHTDGSNSSTDWPAVVRSIWTDHTYTRSWGDIGYNWLVDPNGIIYEGRAGGDNVIGAHFSCVNTNTLGIAALGTFTSISPTASALANIKNLLAWKCDQRTINPLGSAYHSPSQLTLMNISGHKDANTSPNACSTTVCPGDNLYAQLSTIRTDVNNLLAQSPPTVVTNAATSVTNSSATLNATITNDGGSSILERRFDWGTTPGGGGWTDWTANVVVSGNNFSYSLPGLTSGTTYYFRAWAKNSSGWSYDGIVSFTTVSTPTLVAPGNNSHPSSAFSFQWSNVSNATNYKLWLLYPGSSTWLSDMTTSTNYVFSPTLFGEFHWKVQAYVSGTWSEYSSEWIFYWDGLPSPTLVSPLNNSQISVLRPTFQWNLLSGATYYELQLSRNSSFTDMVRDNLTIYGSSWQLDNQDLVSGQTYYWHIRSNSPIGQWSSTWQFQVLTSVTISTSSFPTNGGTSNGGGTYQIGQSVTVTATANNCYTFTNWTENGNIVSTSSNYNFTASNNRSLVANFTQITYNINTSSNPSNGGTTSGGGNMNCGNSITVTATANNCYTFTNWTENGNIVSTSSSYTFSASSNRNLVANFTQSIYSISLTSNPSNGGTTTGGGNIGCGNSVTVTATANNCYTFTNWTENGNIVSTNNNYQFTASSNRNLVANFAQTTYSINISSNPSNGGITAGGGNVGCGNSVTVTATANNCYTFANWTENGNVVSTNAVYTFSVSSNRNLIANFALITYAINLSANPVNGGSVNGGGQVNCGQSITVTAVPNNLFIFNSWKENGNVVSTSASYQFTASSNRTLVAEFQPTVDVKEHKIIPAQYYVHQNYPNPFNPKTNIRFDLPKEEFVTLTVFDILGKEITTLVNQTMSAGSYSVDFDGSNFQSGIYIYRIVAGEFSETKKLLLIK
jgi:hypothetical protein